MIEADVSKTTLDDAVWPEGSPVIDGVIMCYDASDPDSFLPVEGLLRELPCFSMRLPLSYGCFFRAIPSHDDPNGGPRLQVRLGTPS